MGPPLYRPQVATLVSEAPDGEQWLHEIKYDGYRIGCRVARERVPWRLRRLRADPWKETWKTRQRLTAPALEAVGAL